MSAEIMEQIKQQIEDNPILLFMKGNPVCRSAVFLPRAVQMLIACGERFAYVDVLENPEIRSELPKYANWPTFPQLWINGELVGGSDIMSDMYEKGELQAMIKAATARSNTPPSF